LVGNKGCRKYLKREVEQAIFSIDEEKLKAEERFDGKCVLVTSTTYSAEHGHYSEISAHIKLIIGKINFPRYSQTTKEARSCILDPLFGW
jgi:hypothetical protein